jgi:hypothetical protein
MGFSSQCVVAVLTVAAAVATIAAVVALYAVVMALITVTASTRKETNGRYLGITPQGSEEKNFFVVCS